MKNYATAIPINKATSEAQFTDRRPALKCLETIVPLVKRTIRDPAKMPASSSDRRHKRVARLQRHQFFGKIPRSRSRFTASAPARGNLYRTGLFDSLCRHSLVATERPIAQTPDLIASE
jgi:hypothetical protein